MRANRSPEAFDPFDPDTIECPYGFYAALRDGAPVFRMARGGHFVVSRFEDVRAVAMNPRAFSSRLVAVPTREGIMRLAALEGNAESEGPACTLAIADDPAHARQRKLLTRVFSTHEVARREPAIRRLANELVDSFAGAGRAELVAELAVPLPMTIIADVLGFPRGDLAQLKIWSDAGVLLLSGVTETEELLAAGRQTIEFQEYLSAKIDEKRRSPADDVASLVAAAEDDELGRAEQVNLLVQLVIAGNESTASTIASALWLSLRDPALAAAIRADPAAIPALVEEALRLESPFQGHFRVALEDVEVGGVRIPQGSIVMLLWGSANRDPSVFPDPDRVDGSRPNAKQHLAFGEGIHYCLGAALARLEARVAIECALERLANLRLAPAFVARHQRSLFIRRLESLVVEFDGVTRSDGPATPERMRIRPALR